MTLEISKRVHDIKPAKEVISGKIVLASGKKLKAPRILEIVELPYLCTEFRRLDIIHRARAAWSRRPRFTSETDHSLVLLHEAERA